MTREVLMSCQECGAHVDVTIWDLGHKDSDQMDCQCCGKVIKKWHNQAADYSISGVVNHGKVKINSREFASYLGKQLHFSKSGKDFYGTVFGQAEGMIAIEPGRFATPWFVRTSAGDEIVLPEDGWSICFCTQ